MKTVRLSLLFFAFLASTCGQSDSEIPIRVLPPERSADLSIRYFLTGAFGGVGVMNGSHEPEDSVTIPISYKGIRAKTAKAVLYAPGCEMQLFETESIARAPAQVVFSCSPLRTVVFQGAIERWDSNRMTDTVIKVDYLGFWAHRFFGIADGMVMTLPIGEAVPSNDGTFRIDVPDFSADPTWLSLGKHACMQMVVQRRRSGNTLGALIPAESSNECGLGVNVAPVYPYGLKLRLQNW